MLNKKLNFEKDQRNEILYSVNQLTYQSPPRVKTWRELGVVKVAPMKAEPELAGETTTL